MHKIQTRAVHFDFGLLHLWTFGSWLIILAFCLFSLLRFFGLVVGVIPLTHAVSNARLYNFVVQETRHLRRRNTMAWGLAMIHKKGSMWENEIFFQRVVCIFHHNIRSVFHWILKAHLTASIHKLLNAKSKVRHVKRGHQKSFTVNGAYIFFCLRI